MLERKIRSIPIDDFIDFLNYCSDNDEDYGIILWGLDKESEWKQQDHLDIEVRKDVKELDFFMYADADLEKYKEKHRFKLKRA